MRAGHVKEALINSACISWRVFLHELWPRFSIVNCAMRDAPVSVIEQSA